MARENQGLQIALIVFVMLTIILGVTTFLFFRQYEEATTRATEATAKATTSDAAARKAVEEANEFKRMLGFAATDTLQTAQEGYAADMRTYAGTMPEENRFYRSVLEYMFTVLKTVETDVTDGKLALETLKKDFVTREASKDPQIASAEKRATDAENALKTASADYTAERGRMKADQDKIAGQLVDVRKQSDATVATVTAKVEAQAKRIEQLTTEFTDVQGTIREMTDPHLAVVDGEVSWVDQRARTVWVNLGRADGLSRGASFAVYNVDATELTPEAKKASIEVTQILGERLSEARIVEDTLTNPVQPGDKVFTPIWNPGEQKHFALAGKLDIDGDGREDYDAVYRIITMHGGVIDAAQRVNPPKLEGRITPNTTYLILGTAPDENSAPEVSKQFSDLIGEAKRLQVPTLSLNDLLQQMGWQPSRAEVFGNSPDLKAGAVAPGGNSPFRSRRPPARTGTSTY